jgi:hypothetical protein
LLVGVQGETINGNAVLDKLGQALRNDIWMTPLDIDELETSREGRRGFDEWSLSDRPPPSKNLSALGEHCRIGNPIRGF